MRNQALEQWLPPVGGRQRPCDMGGERQLTFHLGPQERRLGDRHLDGDAADDPAGAAVYLPDRDAIDLSFDDALGERDRNQRRNADRDPGQRQPGAVADPEADGLVVEQGEGAGADPADQHRRDVGGVDVGEIERDLGVRRQILPLEEELVRIGELLGDRGAVGVTSPWPRVGEKMGSPRSICDGATSNVCIAVRDTERPGFSSPMIARLRCPRLSLSRGRRRGSRVAGEDDLGDDAIVPAAQQVADRQGRGVGEGAVVRWRGREALGREVDVEIAAEMAVTSAPELSGTMSWMS